MTEVRGMLRHGRKDAFEKFADISKVLEPSPSTKMTWCSNFTFAVFLLHSVLASCLHFLSVARRWLQSTARPQIQFLKPAFILSCTGCSSATITPL